MTELAVYEDEEQVPQRFGRKAEIANIQKRIVSMMPGAAEAPQDVQFAAAQLAVMHGLNPFNGEIYIIKTGAKKVGNQWVDVYVPYVGVKGLRTLARRQSNFMAEERALSPEEVKHLRRGLYDPQDVGVEVTLYRLDVARECKDLDIPYIPVKATGIWRAKAQYNKKFKEWKPDGIPNTWTERDVAAKRAEVSAIKKAFDMVIDVLDPSGEPSFDVLSEQVAEMDRDESPIAPTHQIEYDEDDGMMYAASRTPAPAAEVEPEDATWGELADDAPDFDDIPGARERGDIADTLAGTSLKFVQHLRQKHGDGGPAGDDELQQLHDVLHAIIGDPDAATGELVAAILNSQNTPSADAAAAMLRFLPEENDGKANPEYRKDCASAVQVMWKTLNE